MPSPRYSVRPIADEDCARLNPVDDEIVATDDLAEAQRAASAASYPYGAGIEDRTTGLVDLGRGFGASIA